MTSDPRQQRRGGPGGPPGQGPGGRGQGPRGPGGQGGPGGFRGGPGGREGPRGARGDRRGGRDEGRGESGSSFRVISELGVLEKGLSTGDFAKQKGALEQIVKALRPLRLTSLEQLDMNTRGRLLTTLLRVTRQPKPPPAEGGAAEAAPAEAPQPETAAPSSEGPSETVSAEPGAEQTGAEASGTEPSGAEATPAAETAPEAPTPATPPVDEKTKGWTDVIYLVGKTWRAVGAGERADAAFALSGRAEEKDPEPTSPPAAESSARGEGKRGREPRGAGREGQGAREPRGERKEKRAREPRERDTGLPPGVVLATDWKEASKQLEELGRTRDAARLHAKYNSHAEAARLFLIGGDNRGALRALLDAKDVEGARRLVSTLKPEEAKPILEKAQAWELLMELYVQAQDFENVARLYERARQFDQAGLAWERAGKLALARKAYERARDGLGVARVRGLEVGRLIERGDRLGAATLLVQGGERAEALKLLGALPPPKAFRFMQRLGLNDEATALANAELARAETENKPVLRARWLENLGEKEKAAEAWEKADRKDRAAIVYEQLGQLEKAATLAEAAGDRDRAIALYEKLGDSAGVQRATALPPPQPKSRAQREAEGEDTDAQEGEAATSADVAPEGSGATE